MTNCFQVSAQDCVWNELVTIRFPFWLRHIEEAAPRMNRREVFAKRNKLNSDPQLLEGTFKH